MAKRVDVDTTVVGVRRRLEVTRRSPLATMISETPVKTFNAGWSAQKKRMAHPECICVYIFLYNMFSPLDICTFFRSRSS
ncbi:hypothetical protein F2P81_025590 [Scophthalmus maximus]|uniref:Uncharacterized protein n=1 Tax=Scophthalmus maximus TaxID=52904 RepID=A0A6A4RQ07_SCOMX|nr:hypothetical protein F2P81_025590 [Scophthalmus maximus]